MSSTLPQVDFPAETPLLPVEWRLRINERLAGGLPSPYAQPFVDQIVGMVVAHATRRHGDQAVAAAVAIANDRPLDAAEIEGRVLAGESDAEVGQAINLPPETVAAYVAVFFDVRHLLDSRDRLWSIAAGEMRTRPPVPKEAIRFAGFKFDGPTVGLVADYFRRGLDDGRRITGTPGLSSNDCRDLRAVRSWLGKIGPMTDQAVLYRGIAHRKKTEHEGRRSAAGEQAA